MSFNHVTKKKELQFITNIKKYVVNTLILLGLSSGEQIQATPNHPFFVKGVYQEASALHTGDTLFTDKGNVITLKSVITKDSLATVYNFTVAGNNNYFVGRDGVLVHNINCEASNLSKYKVITEKLDNFPAELKAAFMEDFVNADESILKVLDGEMGMEAWKSLFLLQKLRVDPITLESASKALSNNALLAIGFDQDVLQKMLEFEINENNLKEMELEEMLKNLLPENINLKYAVGGHFENADEDEIMFNYRFFYDFGKFKEKAGRLKEGYIPSEWTDKNKYEELLNAKYSERYGWNWSYHEYKEISKNNLEIGLGLDRGLENWANLNGFKIYKENMFVKIGHTRVFQTQWKEAFFQTMCSIRANNGKIHFRLEGIDEKTLNILGDPKILDTNTNFEIKNIIRNKDWLENTIWYLSGGKYTFGQGSKDIEVKKVLDNLGIKPFYFE